MKLLLETGRTSKIQGFVSRKTGKPFDATLVLRDGKAEFDFTNQP
jgi:DNA topoisomerase-3